MFETLINLPTGNDPKDARHIEKLAKMPQPKPVESAGNWCDIMTWFPEGKVFHVDYEGFGHRLEIDFVTNPNRSLNFKKVIVDGDNLSELVSKYGGNAITTTYSKRAYDCSKYDYYLGWDLSGDFIDQVSNKSGVESFIIYANYFFIKI